MNAPLQRALLTAGLVVTMALGAACAAPASEDVDADNGTGALVGGHEAKTSQFPATVYLKGECTATKVGPKQLLTAAHCVLDPATVSLRYAVGSRLSITRDPSQGFVDYEVAAIHVSPTWLKACDESYCAASAVTARLDAADVAVIDLATDLLDVPIASVDATPLVAGDAVTVIGFGCTVGVLVPDARDHVTLAYADSRVVPADRAVHDGSAVLASDVAQVAGIYSLTAGPGASKASAGLCPGDSGGPLYKSVDGKLVVVGVNSNYTLGPEANDQVGLPITNWHTRLDEKSRHGVAAWLRTLGIKTL